MGGTGYSAVRHRHYGDASPQIQEATAFQHDPGKREFCGQVGGGEWLRVGDDEIESVGRAGRKSGLILSDHPLGGLPHHDALVIEQEADGAGRLDLLGQAIFHRQFHDGFLADNFGWRGSDGKLGRRGQQQQGRMDTDAEEFIDDIHLLAHGGDWGLSWLPT